MSIQYPGGTLVVSDFTQSSGTRRELVDSIAGDLVTCGWSYISGSGTGNPKLTSASTPTANNSISIELNDPGSGNCMTLKLRNATGTLVGQSHFLLPAASKTWKRNVSKYHCLYTTGGSPSAREFIYFGTLYIPPFLNGVLTSDLGFIQGNASSDGDTNVRLCYRYAIGTGTGSTVSGTSGSLAYQSMIKSATLLDVNAGSAIACQKLLPALPSILDLSTQTCYRWHDGTQVASEPRVAFGIASASDEPKVNGQLWGGVVLSDSWSADIAISLDSHNFVTVTNSNAGSNGQYARGTLCLATN